MASADVPYCNGAYAEDMSAMSPRAHEIEQQAATYAFAVRTSATYECVSYGSDGELHKRPIAALAYGTAFGYRRDGNDTLLVTNEHVAEWPAVTDADHPVDGVPAGCKRIADALAIVDDDHDDYAPDDVPLARVVADPALDVAILRAHAPLGVLPWRVGKSAALVARDAVEVKGFPLGEFRATNVGKVISAYAHDDQGDWNHDDFVVDALLTSGGSGSPVLAISCQTGEPELVGIFHARFTGASALNVVVAIDQVRDLMATLKRAPRPDPVSEPDTAARTRLADAVRAAPGAPFFAVGSLPASVRMRADGALVFALYSADFPRTATPVLVIEDLAPPADEPKLFGKLGAAYIGAATGLRLYAPDDGDAESHATLARALALLRADALAAFDGRAAAATAGSSRDAFERAARGQRALARMLDGQRDSVQAIAEYAGKLAGRLAVKPVTLAQVEAGP
ncbi:MAG TPA: serine protease [Kofleriaceae bacterium]|nr:serine protease [Kofleriaceae bacterium]